MTSDSPAATTRATERATALRDRLRAATAAKHARAEALPVFAALDAGALPLGGYVAFLRSLRPIHAALREQLRACPDPRLRDLDAAVPDDLHLLDRDLATLATLPGVAPADELSVAIVRGLIAAHTLRVTAATTPASLAGFAYVLRGSTLGGRALAPRLAASLGLSADRGLAWLTGAADLAPSWARFVARLNALDLGDDGEAQALAAAGRLFDLVHDVLAAVHPAKDAARRDLLAELNREAGTHPIASDPAVLDAALRAGERSWAAFPYYGARYGERGRAFTRSDSAWLASLCEVSADQAVREVVWLGSVLASRGMPQWLLERHLRVLYDELAAATPPADAGDPYQNLVRAADVLQSVRVASLSDATLGALAAAFRARVPEAEARALPEAGALIGAAVADERFGLSRAVPSLLSWLADPDRFGAAWLAAVKDVAAEARAATASRARRPARDARTAFDDDGQP